MKIKKIITFFSATLLTCSIAFAHVSNEYTVYDDMNYSKAKEDVLKLKALGVIPYTEGATIYSPSDILTKSELGYWAAQFLTKSDEPKTEKDYINLAINLEIVADEKGNATYNDVITAYFGKEAVKDKDIQEFVNKKGKETINKEEFALLLGQLIERKEKTGLFIKSGMQKGPSGVIESVKTESVTESDSTYSVYKVTIGGQEYPLNHHPKVVYGPTDIESWQGREVAQTWLNFGEVVEGEQVPLEVAYLEAKKGEFDTKAYAPDNYQTNGEGEKEEKDGFPWVLVGGLFVVIVLVFAILKARKR